MLVHFQMQCAETMSLNPRAGAKPDITMRSVVRRAITHSTVRARKQRKRLHALLLAEYPVPAPHMLGVLP
jgi:hypothetical protein